MAYFQGYYPQYNNGAMNDVLNQYKGQYQMPVQQPMMQPQMPMQQPVHPAQTAPTPTNDMIWVLSEGEAQSYPVAPNNSVILWDKNSDVVYIKSVNAQNVPSFRVLDYKERMAENAKKTPVEHNCECGDKFVLKKDFEAIQIDLEVLRGELNELKAKTKQKTVKKASEEANDGE